MIILHVLCYAIAGILTAIVMFYFIKNAFGIILLALVALLSAFRRIKKEH
jgi:hypothetical protein